MSHTSETVAARSAAVAAFLLDDAAAALDSDCAPSSSTTSGEAASEGFTEDLEWLLGDVNPGASAAFLEFLRA